MLHGIAVPARGQREERDRLAGLDPVAAARPDGLDGRADLVPLDAREAGAARVLGQSPFEEVEVRAADADGRRPHDHLARAGLVRLAHVADAHRADRFGDRRDHRSVLLAAATTSSTPGRYASSSGGLNGIGANGAPTRSIGASR